MTTPLKRDSALEHWLQRSRRDPSPADTAQACLDFETAAAWVGGALAPSALARVQAHTAYCARCQALLRTLSDVEDAALPSPPSARRHTWSVWMKWMLPVGAAATAVLAIAVWVRTPQPPGVSSVPEVAARSSAPAPAQSGSALEPPVAGAIPLPDARREPPPPDPPSNAAKAADAVSEQRKVQNEAAPPSAAAAEPRALTQSTSAVADAAPRPAAPAPPPPSPPAPAAAGVAGRLMMGASLEVAAAGSTTRWRIAGTTVERTTDAGVTWTSVSTGATLPLHAGSAPSADVCWLAGDRGVVLLTTDGSSWTRLPSPGTADLTSVVAQDARSATVTTADGRQFTTVDAGQSWTAR